MITQSDLLLQHQREAEQELAGSILANPLILMEDDLHIDSTVLIDQRIKEFWSKIQNRRGEIVSLNELEEQITLIQEIAISIDGLVPKIYSWIPKWSYDEFKTDQEVASEAVKRITKLIITREMGDEIAQSFAIDVEYNSETIPTVEDVQSSDRFDVHWAAEAFDQPPTTEFVVDGLITAGSVNLCVGEGGTKKTWAMIDLGVSVARGEKWLDFKTKQCAVLFIDEESGQKRFLRRLNQVLQGHLANSETPFAFVSLAQLNLRDIEDVNALHVLIEHTRAGLVVIDALADIMPGADENAVKDVQPIFMALRKIAEVTDAAIIIIHHANKAGGYRGSTALKGAVDLLVMVESKPKSNYIAFRVEKARDIEPIEFSAVANFVTEAGQFWLSAVETSSELVKFGKAQEYVIRYLAEHGKSNMESIRDHADTCAPNGARQAVYNLTGLGYTARVDEGGRGEKATYDLTEKGKKYAKHASYM